MQMGKSPQQNFIFKFKNKNRMGTTNSYFYLLEMYWLRRQSRDAKTTEITDYEANSILEVKNISRLIIYSHYRTK